MMIWFSLITISAISFICWYFFGRDPESKTPYPYFEPPKGLSAGIVRYIDRMSFDPKIFTVYLVSLASKGYIEILQSDEPIGSKGYWYSIEKLNGAEGGSSLTEDEEMFFQALFEDNAEEIAVRETESHAIHKALQELEDYFKENVSKKYLKSNRNIMLIITAVALLLILVSQIIMGISFFSFIPISMGAGLLTLFLWSIVKAYGPYFTGDARFSITTIPFMFFHIFVFLFVGIPFLYFVTVDIPPEFILGVASIVIVLYLTYKALLTRTDEGREIQNMTEGFKMFLSATEEERIELFNQYKIPSSNSEHILTEYLPYSLAFDLDTEWSKRLTKFLKVVEEEGDLFSTSGYEKDQLKRVAINETLLQRRDAEVK